MMNQTLTRLRSLRLTGMADALLVNSRSSPAPMMSLSFEERLSLLTEQEETERNNKRLARLLRECPI